MLLAGDIGGTKTRLALFDPAGELRHPLAEATFASRRYPDLETLAAAFLDPLAIAVDRACFGVPGPVAGGRARATNLPWSIDAEALARRLRIGSVLLLNDLEALARAVPLLGQQELLTLQPGCAAEGGPLAIIAPGTGLGEAYLTWDGSRYRAHPSEGGHADFAPGNDQEIAWLQHLQRRFGHVSWERACSGSALPELFAFLRQRSPEAAGDAPAAGGDPAAAIVAAALDRERPCPVCRRTLATFIAMLGAEAGNLALKVMATGGLYLGGGIPPRLLEPLQDGGFMAAFTRKGRFAPLMERFPVQVILDPRAALRGAAHRLRDGG
jgi:glucokinase